MELDWTAMSQVYLEGGSLTQREFEDMIEAAARIQGLHVLGSGWGISQMILSQHPQIPLLTHYRALHAAFRTGGSGIEAFHVWAIDKGVLPPYSLNRTVFYRPPSRPLRLGEIAVELGLIREEGVRAALEVQGDVERGVGVRVSIGSIFLADLDLSYPDFFQVLGFQTGIPFQDLERSAPAIFEAIGRRLGGGRGPGAPPGTLVS